MGAVSFESGAEAVTALLADPQETIRAAAVRVMARLHHTDGLPDMVGRLVDDSSSVRTATIQALARMDARLVTIALLRNPQVLNEQKLPVLSIMRANPHPLQRGYVETSLASPDEQVRHAAVAAFAAQRGADVVEALAPMLADKSVEVRRSVISALSERPCERTRQLLLGLLERDRETRVDVMEAMGQLGDARIVPKVIAIFSSCTPVEQGQAIDVLAAIESPGVEPFLSRQLGNPDPSVRKHAVKALVRIGTATALRRLGIALRDKRSARTHGGLKGAGLVSSPDRAQRPRTPQPRPRRERGGLRPRPARRLGHSARLGSPGGGGGRGPARTSVDLRSKARNRRAERQSRPTQLRPNGHPPRPPPLPPASGTASLLVDVLRRGRSPGRRPAKGTILLVDVPRKGHVAEPR